MQSNARSPQEYINNLPEERKAVVAALRDTIIRHLPDGFTEVMNYGMLGYVVPHSLYPAGYHVDPKQPLPFISVASQKNHIALYHMGLYEGELLKWFVEEWQKTTGKKPDMGKSCIRFRKPGDVPFGLIGQLVSKLTPQQWIAIYEASIKR